MENPYCNCKLTAKRVLEGCIRAELNETAPRVFACLDPLKVTTPPCSPRSKHRLPLA